MGFLQFIYGMSKFKHAHKAIAVKHLEQAVTSCFDSRPDLSQHAVVHILLQATRA